MPILPIVCVREKLTVFVRNACFRLLVISTLGFKVKVDPHLSPACSGFLRFTSGVTSTDLLMASMAAKPALVLLEPSTECVRMVRATA